MDKDEIINEAIDKLKKLTGDDFHGYRSEIWAVIADVIRKAPKNELVPITAEEIEKIKYDVKLSDIDPEDPNLWWTVRARYDIAFEKIVSKFGSSGKHALNHADLVIRFMSGIYGFNKEQATLIADYIVDNFSK